MTLKKTIDVSRPVLTRTGEPYQETKVDSQGRIILESGEARLSYQVGRGDTPVLEDVPIGRLMVAALDRTDEKLSPEERRKRFVLSCRIEDAIKDKTPFVMDPEDRKRLEAAADLVTNSHFFLYRMQEAIENAEPLREEAAKSNGAAETAVAH